MSLHFQRPLRAEAKGLLFSMLGQPKAEDGRNFLFDKFTVSKKEAFELHRLMNAGDMRCRTPLPFGHPNEYHNERLLDDGRKFRFAPGGWLEVR